MLRTRRFCPLAMSSRMPLQCGKQAQKTAEKLARESELAKVVISKEHVELIMHKMEIPKDKAERTLREHGGDVV